jgi:AraC family transcriptional regulator, regulatory protein of adaptative response / methylated-DNA-[protein]-cysteine methyltransferase
MNLMITEITQQPAREKTGTNASIETVSYSASGSILGEVLVARSVKGVCAILLGDDRDELKADLAIRFPEVNFVSIEAFVRDDLAQVIRFLDNPSDGLRLPLDMRGTPLQRRVWEKLRAIPVGRTVTYTEVAYWVGPLTPARVVAAACAANPIALAIPCHRVVRSKGDLGGYRWGVERKRELIRREGTA